MQPQAPIRKGNYVDTAEFRAALLGWYDSHRRTLPWRALPDSKPNSYHVWLSEIMLQQTVVATVIPYFLKFIEKWPSIADLAAAGQEDIMHEWAGLGYYNRARNMHKCARVVQEQYNGVIPDTQAELLKLPGIGDYTSAAITSIAFDKPATVIDGNVERVLARFYSLKTPFPDGKKDIKPYAEELFMAVCERPGDFAQAMMDLGATICTPKSPKCMLCPLAQGCLAKNEGIAQDLPYKIKKAKKPQKIGFIYWVKDKRGYVLIERRSSKGLLAETMGFPTSEWVAADQEAEHLKWLEPYLNTNYEPIEIRHVFTHFDLKLAGYIIDIKEKYSTPPLGMKWVSSSEIEQIGFPSVFKKFLNQALKVGKSE